MEISIHNFGEIDRHKLATFVIESRKNSVFHNPKLTVGELEGTYDELVRDKNQVLVLALDKNKLIGALVLYIGFPEMAFINEWHPVVSQEGNRERIANKLIQSCKQYITSTGHTRLEVKLSPIKDEHAPAFKEYKSWYENAGFYKATGEVLMEANLEQSVLSSYRPSLPPSITFENIDDHDNSEIEDSFFDSFTSGRDRLFLDMTHSQQKISFNYWFSRQRPFDRASILVMTEGRVIGFNVVRVDEGIAEIGPVGIIPEFQKQGIMKAVLHESIRRLVEDGVKIAQLEADGDNQPAMKLYQSMGFRVAYNQEYYAWKP